MLSISFHKFTLFVKVQYVSVCVCVDLTGSEYPTQTYSEGMQPWALSNDIILQNSKEIPFWILLHVLRY